VVGLDASDRVEQSRISMAAHACDMCLAGYRAWLVGGNKDRGAIRRLSRGISRRGYLLFWCASAEAATFLWNASDRESTAHLQPARVSALAGYVRMPVA
jgi:hypothetical protein